MRFEDKHKFLFALFGLFVLIHLFDLTHFTFSIDDDSWASAGNSLEWISQGRWTLYLFDHLLLPQPVLPFLPTALFGLFCSAGFVLFLEATTEDLPRSIALALFPIFCSFPTWSFLTTFKTNAPGAGLAVFCVCWAAALFHRRCERGGLLLIPAAGLLGAIAMGAYQSFFLLLVIVLLATRIRRVLQYGHFGMIFRDASIACAVLVATLAIYWGITQLVLKISGASMHYVDSFFRPEVFVRHPFPVIYQFLLSASKVYSGSEQVYGVTSHMTAALILLAAFLLWRRTRKLGIARGSLFALASLGAILLVPFGTQLLSGGPMPYRTLVAVPAAICCVVQLGLGDAQIGRKYLLPVIVILGIWPIIHVRSNFQAAQELAAVHDRTLATDLAGRIAAITHPGTSGAPTRIDVFGGLPFRGIYPVAESSTIGASFFAWDGGNPVRIANYMNLLGFHPLMAENNRKLDHLSLFVEMPEWPSAGSVRLAPDGTVLVKLSETPGQNYEPILTAEDQTPGGKPPLFDWASKRAPVNLRRGDRLPFQTENAAVLKSCTRLQFHAAVTFGDPHRFIISYKKRDDSEFQAREVEWRPRSANAPTQVYVQILSSNGFQDDFRLAPAGLNDVVRVDNIQLSCINSHP